MLKYFMKPFLSTKKLLNKLVLKFQCLDSIIKRRSIFRKCKSKNRKRFVSKKSNVWYKKYLLNRNQKLKLLVNLNQLSYLLDLTKKFSNSLNK